MNALKINSNEDFFQTNNTLSTFAFASTPKNLEAIIAKHTKLKLASTEEKNHVVARCMTAMPSNIQQVLNSQEN